MIKQAITRLGPQLNESGSANVYYDEPAFVVATKTRSMCTVVVLLVPLDLSSTAMVHVLKSWYMCSAIALVLWSLTPGGFLGGLLGPFW